MRWPKSSRAGRRWACTRSSGLPVWLALAGVVVAWFLYLVRPDLPAVIKRAFGPIYTLLDNKYYMDKINEVVFARGAVAIGRGLWKEGDVVVIDGIVNGSATLYRLVRRRDPLPPIRLHLSLRVRHDYRHVGAPDPVCNARRQIRRGTLMHAYPILSIAIWLPILVGLLVLAIGSDQNPAPARWIALIGSVVSFIVTIPLITGFDSSTADLQFVEKANWIERFNITYHLGVDGISMWFVVLTALITVIVVIAAWEVITKNVAQYLAAFLILSGIMVGVFSSADGMLFYVFFEATLIPMYIIIGVWGGANRVYAAFKFFLYTLMGSLLMLVALLYLYIADRHVRSGDVADTRRSA